MKQKLSFDTLIFPSNQQPCIFCFLIWHLLQHAGAWNIELSEYTDFTFFCGIINNLYIGQSLNIIGEIDQCLASHKLELQKYMQEQREVIRKRLLIHEKFGEC